MSDVNYQKIKLNVFVNYVYFFIYAASNFILNPLLVKYIGTHDFGIWKSSIRLFEFATFADGRSSQALKWVIARNNSTNCDTDNVKNKAIGSSVFIWFSFLPFCISTVLILTYFLPYFISGLGIDEFENIRMLGLFLGVNILIIPLLEIPDAILVGTNNSYRSKSMQILWLLISNITTLYVVTRGYGLFEMALVLITCALFNAISVFVVAKCSIDWLALSKPTKKEVKIFFSFSGGVMVWAIVEKLLLSSELLLVVSLSGTDNVTKYIFTSFMAQFGLSVVLIIGSAVMPYLGTLMSQNKNIEASAVLSAYRDIILAIITIIGSGILIFNMSFVALWASPEFYIGSFFNLLVVLCFIQVSYIRSNAQIHDLSLKINRRVLHGVIFITSSLLLAIGAFIFSNQVLESILIGLLVGRLGLNIVLSKTVREMTKVKSAGVYKPLMSFIILTISYYLGETLFLSTWLSLFFSGLLTVIVISAICFLLLLSNDTKNIIYRRLNIKSDLGELR